MAASGVLERAVLVFGQMNESPGVRFRVGLTALAYAEYLRDAKGGEVLLLMDNVYRFVQAGSEISSLLGRMPATVGYQPTLLSEVAELQERIVSTDEGSITAVEAIYVPADDMSDPAVSAIMDHLDTQIILSRDQAAKGIYPAVDPLASGSRLLDRHVLGDRHFDIAEGVRSHLSRYRSWRTSSSCWAWRNSPSRTGRSCIAPGGCNATSPSPSTSWRHSPERRAPRCPWSGPSPTATAS